MPITKCSLIGRLSVVAVGLAMLVSGAQSQTSKALADRMQTADVVSGLDAPDVKPWHLKMTVQLFDEKGKPTDNGTIEEWWSAPGVDRREYKTNGYTATEIRNAEKFFRTKEQGPPPYILELLREQAVHPMPKSSEIEQSTPELRKEPFGKLTLDCIMLSRPIPSAAVLPVGLFPTYCFSPDGNVLRASYEFGEQSVLRNAIDLFQTRAVAKDVTVVSGKTKAASSQIITLEETEAPDSQFSVNGELTEQKLRSVKVSSGSIAGMALQQVQPRYPQSAKDRHASGVVVMRALIGTDGHIHSLNVMSAPDPDLAIAAIAAVRKWTYRPFLLLGVPTDVETTINVNFTFGL